MKDSVCGMQVIEVSRFHLQHENETYCFCSEGCLNKFESNSTEYLEGENKQKGCCGHCGTDSPPDTVKKILDSNEVYTCPMHPEVLLRLRMIRDMANYMKVNCTVFVPKIILMSLIAIQRIILITHMKRGNYYEK